MDFQHDHPSEGPSNRSFGYTVGGILLGLVLAKWLISGALSTTSICMAVVGGALVPLGTPAQSAGPSAAGDVVRPCSRQLLDFASARRAGAGHDVLSVLTGSSEVSISSTIKGL